MNESPTHHFSIHGHTVVIQNELPALAPALNDALGEFSSTAHENPALVGTLRRYDRDEVLRHLSTSAISVSVARDGAEIYQDNERFWLIDDRFGLVEINLLKSQWRCWVIDTPAMDWHRVIEMAVLWPAAHLLRGRGICLLPAASVVRGEIGMLLISPLRIEAELSALLRAGFRLIGQTWTALREADGEVEMLHMPGRVERADSGFASTMNWVDLEAEFCGSAIARGVCNQVVMIEPGRRPNASMHPIPRTHALPALRRGWPIAELHPHRVSGGQMPAKLSRCACVFTAQLSHQPNDLLDQLHSQISSGRPVARRIAG